MTYRLTTIDISKENFKFSGAHFTIFSATERERLHGHNFKVKAEIIAPVDDNGMCFNYQEIKIRLRAICDQLDEYVLLPGNSPHLKIETSETFVTAQFQQPDHAVPLIRYAGTAHSKHHRRGIFSLNPQHAG